MNDLTMEGSTLADRSTPYQGVKSLVLGASGFIGRWVARALCDQGARVHLVVRDEMSARRVWAMYGVVGELCAGDLGEPGTVRQVLEGIRPSITFNLVGYGVDRTERDPDVAYQINKRLPRSVCESVADLRDPEWPGQDIVHAGSALEYGDSGGNVAEDSIPNPTTLYGRSKLAGTLALARCCQAQGVKGLTARLFTVYGPGEHEGRLLPSLLSTAIAQKPLELTAGWQKRDFTYVQDVAEGLLRLGVSRAQAGEIVNLATGRLATVRSFVEIAAEVLQIPEDCLEFGALPTRAEEMEHGPVAVDRLQALTGWVPPTSIAEGIRRTWDLFRGSSK
jgi:UDP-glucose 4-epimerase